MPRRKPGTLVPLEIEILTVASSRARSGEGAFYGFGLAQAMRDRGGSSALTGHGTLYKALGRLEESGLLASRWEDASAAEGRPRRRLYEITPRGAERATEHRQDAGAPSPRPVRVPRTAPASESA